MKETVATQRLYVTKQEDNSVKVLSTVNYFRGTPKSTVEEIVYNSEEDGIMQNKKITRVKGSINRGAHALQYGCLAGVWIDIWQDLVDHTDTLGRTFAIVAIAVVATAIKQDARKNELMAINTSSALEELKNSSEASYSRTYPLNFIK